MAELGFDSRILRPDAFQQDKCHGLCSPEAELEARIWIYIIYYGRAPKGLVRMWGVQDREQRKERKNVISGKSSRGQFQLDPTGELRNINYASARLSYIVGKAAPVAEGKSSNVQCIEMVTKNSKGLGQSANNVCYSRLSYFILQTTL